MDAFHTIAVLPKLNLSRLERKLIDQSRILAPVLCEGRCRHLSFICRRNKIVCMGANSYSKTHPISSRFNHLGSCRHSEVSALVNFPLPNSEINRYDIYNVRISKSGEIRLAKPCKNCQRLLTHFNVKKIFFSTDEGTFSHMELS